MPNIDKIIGGMFALIALYLFLSHSQDAANIIGTGGNFISTQTGILQGRGTVGTVSGNRPAAYNTPGGVLVSI